MAFAELSTQAGKVLINTRHIVGVQKSGQISCILTLATGDDIVLDQPYEDVVKEIASPRIRGPQ